MNIAARICIVAAAVALLLAADGRHTLSAPAAGTIMTFAGSEAGDGGQATNATLGSPLHVAVNSAGDTFILDTNRCRIRKVSGGVITNVAGNGDCLGVPPGGSPDGSVAATSPIAPTDLAIGPGDTLYFTESGTNADSCRVRTVSAAGLLTTLAGNGTCGPPTEGAAATASMLEHPSMLAVDGTGNIYVADTFSCGVWKISAGVIHLVAGGNRCGTQFNSDPLQAEITPASIAVDAAGTNLYIAEQGGYQYCFIRKVSGGVMTVIAGASLCGFSPDGTNALSANIQPVDLAVGSTGTLFFADRCGVRTIIGGTLGTAASCTAGPAPYLAGMWAQEVAVRGAGEVWIGDWVHCLVSKVAGIAIVPVAGTGDCDVDGGDGQQAAYATLENPQTVGVDAAGNVYINDHNDCRIRKVSSGIITAFAGNRCGTATFPPIGVGVPATGESVLARSMAVTPAGDVYVFDENGCRLRVISAGMITTLAGSNCAGSLSDGMAAAAAQFYGMQGIAVDPSGTVYIADGCSIWSLSDGTIHAVAGDGSCTSSADGTAALAAGLASPWGLAWHNGDLVFAERDACRVRQVHLGQIETIAGRFSAVSCGFSGDGGAAGLAQLDHPTDVTFDDAGTLYIGDTGNCRVRAVTSKTIRTLAGSATCGFSGDGGPASAASLAEPFPWQPGIAYLGVAVDVLHNVYIADSGNNRIRMVYGDICPAVRAADVTGNGLVDILDLSAIAGYYNQAVPPAPVAYDLQRDGRITILDLSRAAGVYHRSTTGCP